MSDLQALKAGSKARESEERRTAERRRAVLVLILRHLADNGYTDSYERLSSEANLSLNKVDVADNIDLIRVVQEFEESYEMRFGRRPKLVRKLVEEVAGGGGGVRSQGSLLPPVAPSAPNGVTAPSPPSSASSRRLNVLDGPSVGGAMAARQRRERGSASEDARKSELLDRRQNAMDSVKPPAELGAQRVAGVPVSAGNRVLAGLGRDEVAALQLQGLQGAAARLQPPPHARSNTALAGGQAGRGGGEASGDSDPDVFFEQRVLKPIPASLQGELRDLAVVLTRDIFSASPNVRWDSVVGLDEAKRLLQEAVVAPIQYPHLFTGLLAPWKGVLLYGPPGTGKTMLAKAVATECRTTFFNISASSIISKWRGDSEKLVRVLFDLARHHAPSTIFMDEVDALMQARGGEGEHEASRRMKTELLTQIDGISRTNDLVFLLAATNLPWELDAAMLRRLEKRILVTLPTLDARQRIFQHLLTGRCAPEVDMADLAQKTEGYSGSDVEMAAKEAGMRPLRRLLSKLRAPLDASDKAVEAELGPVTPEDVEAALCATKATGIQHAKDYADFTKAYGQVI